MRIITISREFGSGGREVGKRLADALGFAYYDREIVTAIAERTKMDAAFVENTLESGLFRNFPVSFGRTLSYTPTLVSESASLFAEQHKLIRELAEKGDCIIVGRAANMLLQAHNPFNLFVYADMPSKIARCHARTPAGEKPLSDKEMEKKIRRVDMERARYHELFSGTPWGDKAGYQLCVNTTGVEIKSLIPMIADYAKNWLDQNAK